MLTALNTHLTPFHKWLKAVVKREMLFSKPSLVNHSFKHTKKESDIDGGKKQKL